MAKFLGVGVVGSSSRSEHADRMQYQLTFEELSCHNFCGQRKENNLLLLYYIILFQALTKELETKTGLKTTVITTGTQLVQLREPGGDLDREPEDSEVLLSQMSDSDLCSVQSQLRHIELDWSSLLHDVPVVQQELHQVRCQDSDVSILTFLTSSLKHSQ